MMERDATVKEATAMRRRQVYRSIAWAVCLGLVSILILPGVSSARSAQEIDASVTAVLNRFTQQVKGSRDLLQTARGVLVFADVIKAGIGVGGEYGEGALRIRGRTVAYYSIAAASIGIQFGAQKKDIIIVFLQDKALQDFQASDGWQGGGGGALWPGGPTERLGVRCTGAVAEGLPAPGHRGPREDCGKVGAAAHDPETDL